MPKLKVFIYSLSTLIGTVIGVGLFSLPYITAKVGMPVMIGYFLVLGFLVILLHLYFAELVIIAPDYKRLPGFARIYLGRFGEKAAFISNILGFFGVILSYLIVGGQFLKELLSPFFGGSADLYTILYFSAGAIFIYFGIKTISKIELASVVFFFFVFIALFFKFQPYLKIENLFPVPDFKYWFLPYGPILFSLWGLPLIPEIEEMLIGNKELMKKVISIGIGITIIFYLFFIYLILGVTGKETTESALVGLKGIFGNAVISVFLFFGIATTFTSFIAIGLSLNKVLHYDMKIGKTLAWLICCFAPLALFFVGFKNFIAVISFIGGVMLAIDGILVLLMYRKARLNFQPSKAKSLLVYPLILVLFFGIIYEVIHFLK